MSKPLALAMLLFIPLISGCLGEVAEETTPEPEAEATIWVDHLFTAAMRLNPNSSIDILGSDGWIPAVRTGNATISWAYPVTGEGDVPANETLFCTYFSNETDQTETCVPSLMTPNTFWRTLQLGPEGWNTSCIVLAEVPDNMTMDDVDDGYWHQTWEAIVQADIDAGLQPSWCTDYY